ncbi:hypothetical protein ACFO3D_16345 [Virgibacillus kekensis]|uniref:Uncharacterized protein n=1 Tax=Virgibacillus kekensis TaxID=202261 RepID=A0ABV9DMW3_9BACI
MIKKMIALFVIIVLGIVGWYWTEGYGFTGTDVTGETIEESIFQYTSSDQNQVSNQGDLIEKIQVKEDFYLVFTLNKSLDSINAFLIKKKWNGNWRVENMSGEASIELHPGAYSPYSWNGLSSEDFSGYWGVVYDSDVESIVLRKNMKEAHANIIDSTRFPPIWYKLYPESDLNDIEIVKAVDIDGEEVPWDSVRNKSY